MAEPKYVLGVSAYYHDSAAAIVSDGQIVAAAQEERFTRTKGEARLPKDAIEYALEEAGIAPAALEAAVFYESPFRKLDRLLTTQVLGRPQGIRGFTRSMRTWLPDKLWAANQLRDLLGKDTRILVADHHLSHAASAFYPSPFEDAAVLTVDGVGEWSTTTIGQGSGSNLALTEHIEYPNSLGLLYSAFTLYCGFKVNSGEYKLMGLAPYGRPVYAETIERELIHLSEDGSFALNPRYFTYMHSLTTYGKAFERLLGGPARRADEELNERHADLAASIQEVTNKAMLGLARRAHEATRRRNLCLAGGVALNIVSVSHIEENGPFANVWVQPAAGDAGGALGAALWASHCQLGVPRTASPSDGMHGAFLGPRPGRGKDSAETLQEYGLTSIELNPEQLSERIANDLTMGKVVGIARGRMEYGPRALGARSILADARDPEMQSRLNLKTKYRESFRPFAPMVLAEHAEEYFTTAGNESPYMLKTYPVSPSRRTADKDDQGEQKAASPYERVKEKRSEIPAVTHVDYSARVQTVDRERNPFIHQVLTAFHHNTGCPVIVNTSFNVRGEPIVNTARDAIECFLANDIDVLVLDNHVVERSKQDPGSLTPRRKSARKDD